MKSIRVALCDIRLLGIWWLDGVMHIYNQWSIRLICRKSIWLCATSSRYCTIVEQCWVWLENWMDCCPVSWDWDCVVVPMVNSTIYCLGTVGEGWVVVVHVLHIEYFLFVVMICVFYSFREGLIPKSITVVSFWFLASNELLLDCCTYLSFHKSTSC